MNAIFRHNLLLFRRIIKKYKSSFFINLIGLSTGLTCVILIFLWVNDEINVDKFHEKDSQLFQVMMHNRSANRVEVWPYTPGVLAEALVEEVPEVEYAVPVGFSIFGKQTLSFDERSIKAEGIYTGEDYFNIFSYDLIQGDKNQVLLDENNIVISEKLAMKLFNTTENVVGKAVDFNNKYTFLVSGIIKDITPNSSTQFDFVLNFKIIKKHYPYIPINWTNYYPYTYIILKKGTNIAFFNNKIKNLLEEKSGLKIDKTLFVRQYSQAYLYGRYENGIQTGGRIEYVKLFSIIAIFILLIACINFMNLSTSQATNRMLEVGIKKTLGAERRSLIFQHLGESIFMAFLSLIFAMVFVEFFLPKFNEISGKQITFGLNINLILYLLGITVITGIIAGSYPALYLSGFSPVKVLKGKFSTSLSELWTRRGLVVFQFTLSVILIIAVLIVNKQLEFIQNRNLGYKKDNIICFDIEGRVKERLKTFLSEMKNIPGINDASSIFMNFLGLSTCTPEFSWEEKDPNYIVEMHYRMVNYGMVEMLGIEMKEGRAFSKDYSLDRTKIILNERAIELMGFHDPIGKTVKLWEGNYQIIGIVKNFYFESLHENVKPVFFYLNPEITNTIMVKIESERLGETLDKLRKFYKQFNPGFPLDYKFLDQDFQALYTAEKRVAVLSRYFAGLAIIISCLGLFGLTSFTIEKRRKEISIRRVLGCNNFNIIYLLTIDFTKLVLTSLLIALPISYLLANKWLNSYVLRINLEIGYFIIASLIVLLITWITVGSQTIRALKFNLSQSLRMKE